MGEVPMNVNGILPKIVSLFNNKLFSDFQFVFDHGELSSTLYGHKLILAVRSNYFASMFYEEEKDLDRLHFPGDKKSLCYILLRFLYTDDACLDTLTIKEVEDLRKLANCFGIKDLESKCVDYVLKEKITIENIFPRYEQALSSKFTYLLTNCRKFVSAEAMSVFQSTEFSYASTIIIEDILKLNDLSVSTELIIVNSILKWCIATCKKDNYTLDDKYLREQIYPFFKYLRFLTLSAKEFQSVVEKYNIFTGYESTILTCKILQPESEITIPDYICSETTKRENLVADTKPAIFSKLDKSIPANDSGGNLIINTTPALFSKSEKLISSVPKENSVGKVSYLDDLIDVTIKNTKQLSITPNIPTDDSKFNMRQPILQYQRSVSKSNKFSYEIEKQTPFEKNKASKFQSSPNSNAFPFYTCTPQRTFQFPLSEISESFISSFQRDLRCNVVFKMKNGSIKLYGFDIYVKSSSASKKLNIDVDVTGFSTRFSESYSDITFRNNAYKVVFPKPLLLQEEQIGTLEVSIDNLYLNRCLVYSSDTCELNNGSSCTCEIIMKSNNKASNGFAFLIYNFHYSPL